MGLLVHVLKPCGEREDRTLVQSMGAPAPGPFEPTPERPAVLVDYAPDGVTIAVFDAIVDPSAAVSLDRYQRERVEGKLGPMADGRFVWTSDGRFPAMWPLAYFDRWETRELNEAMR